MNKNGDRPLYLQSVERIKEKISRLASGSNKLPTENDLAKEFNVSKTTIRQAMNQLVKEGLVTRKQGSGIYGHPHALNLKMRIDLNWDFHKILLSLGYRVSFRQGEITIRPASEQMVKRLPLWADHEMYTFTWTDYADDIPAIASRLEIPREISHKKDIPKDVFVSIESCFHYFGVHDLTYSISWQKVGKDPELTTLFRGPVVAWDEALYDIHDRAVCFVELFFNPEVVDLSMTHRF